MPSVDEMIQRAKVLSCPVRVSIWQAIGPYGSTPGELAATFGLAPSSVTYHLKILQDAGLIGVHRRGRYRIYKGLGIALTIATEDELEATYGTRPAVSP